MDGSILDTQLHTRFPIFPYALKLETAILTRYVPSDAADAERSATCLWRITLLAETPAELAMLRSLPRATYTN